MNARSTLRFCAVPVCATALLLVMANDAAATDFFVDANAGSSGNGRTWGGAFLTLEEALDEARAEPPANAPHTIKVAGTVAGTYYVPEAEQPPSARAGSFEIASNLEGLQLLGGYVGANNLDLQHEMHHDRRDPARFITILSGDLARTPGGGVGVLDTGGWDDASRNDNSQHVLMVSNVSSNTRIDGFVIEGGRGLGQSAIGAGLYVVDANISVSNCTFRFNSAGTPRPGPPAEECSQGQRGLGGAVAVEGFSPEGGPGTVRMMRMHDCIFLFNTATEGGAVWISGNVIEEPDPDEDPQLVVEMVNCVIARNEVFKVTGVQVDGRGAAVFMEQYALLKMHHCTVADNIATTGTCDVTTMGVGGGVMVFCVEDRTHLGQLWTGAEVSGGIFYGNRADNIINNFTTEILGACAVPRAFAVLTDCDVEGILDPQSTDHIAVPQSSGLVDIAPQFNPLSVTDYRLAYSLVIQGENADLIDQLTLNGFPSDALDVDGDSNLSEPVPDPQHVDRISNGLADYDAYEQFFDCCSDFIGDDGHIGVAEFIEVLTQWGCEVACAADVCEDGLVGVDDFLLVLKQWGQCGTFPSLPTETCNCQTMQEDEDGYHTEQSPSRQLAEGMYGPVSDIWDEAFGGGFPKTLVTRYRLAAGDFQPVGNQSISVLHWWGFYDDDGADCSGAYVDDFTVTYYASRIHPGTGNQVPDPANVLATFANVTPAKMEDGTLPNGEALWLYAFEHSPVAVTDGTCYFVEIKNAGGDTTGASGCHWRWAWSVDGQDIYSAKKPENADDYLDASDPDHAMNLAFGLNIQFNTYSPSFPCGEQ